MSTTTAKTERDPQTSAIIAAAIEVHRHLGRGFLEYVYRTPLELELLERGIPFKREVQFPILYKGKRTGIAFRVDLVCYGEVIVELKAMKALTGAEHAQVINYLHASGLERGLLLNFGTPILTIERFVHTASRDARRAANLTDREREARQEGEQQRDEGGAQT
jgi:GxxExxY protein